MSKRTGMLVASLVFATLAGTLRARQLPPWHDPSPHLARLVKVEENVWLEVLDWGGSGRPIVLLAGLGNTAHVFDEFAPKLIGSGHVYGITRRGYGASGASPSGYAADLLGDDVIAVLESLPVNAPAVLVGHSIAGQELSSAASRHPDRVAGLVYLDALFSYSYATPREVSLRASMAQLQRELLAVQSRPPDPLGIPQPPDVVGRLLRTMSELQQQLEALRLPPSSSPQAPATPAAADLESYAALRSWFGRARGFQPPEAELRQGRDAAPGSQVGRSRTPPSVPPAIIGAARTFADIRVPALAMCAIPPAPGPAATTSTDAESARVTALRESRARAFEQNVAGARVVRVPHAHHYIFLSHEALVLREITAFLRELK